MVLHRRRNLRCIVVKVLCCFSALLTHDCTILESPSCCLSQKNSSEGWSCQRAKKLLVKTSKPRAQISLALPWSWQPLHPLVHIILTCTGNFTAVRDVSVAMGDHRGGEMSLDSPVESDPGKIFAIISVKSVICTTHRCY